MTWCEGCGKRIRGTELRRAKHFARAEPHLSKTERKGVA